MNWINIYEKFKIFILARLNVDLNHNIIWPNSKWITFNLARWTNVVLDIALLEKVIERIPPGTSLFIFRLEFYNSVLTSHKI